jgi:hypothetical protein
MHLIVFVCSLLLVCVGWFFNFWMLVGEDETVRGTFGDMFGAANAAFSGLALVFIVYAVFVQREEVKIAKEDLRNTKIMIEGQKNELNK